jgi:hypothetical protein
MWTSLLYSCWYRWRKMIYRMREFCLFWKAPIFDEVVVSSHLVGLSQQESMLLIKAMPFTVKL